MTKMAQTPQTGQGVCILTVSQLPVFYNRLCARKLLFPGKAFFRVLQIPCGTGEAFDLYDPAFGPEHKYFFTGACFLKKYNTPDVVR